MSAHIVRLGSPRRYDEGVRIGTVRRPPRGVRREHFVRDNWYDVWLPTLAPSAPLVRLALDASSAAQWRRFERDYRTEMRVPAARHTLDLLATLSHHSNFSVGCYCVDEARCHRSILRALLSERGALLAPGEAAAVTHGD